MTGSPPGVWIRAEDPSTIGAVRRTATALARTAGFDSTQTGKVATAVTEAVSNLVKHAQESTVLVRQHPEAAGTVEVVTVDRGPGIPDVARAMTDGYSTTGTLGIGLSAITRMATGYDVYSAAGKGTVLAMHFTAPGAPAPSLRASGLVRPIGEEVVCGDGYALAETGSAIIAMVCDGLGHGEVAAHATAEALRIFLEDPDLPPMRIVGRVHDGIRHTRGGAIGVARIERRTVTYAGLGNVSAWIVDGRKRLGMISLPGIAGQRSGRLRQYTYESPPHATVVLHSDGLSRRWTPQSLPGLFPHSPVVIAATLLREVGSRRDDACVVTVRCES